MGGGLESRCVGRVYHDTHDLRITLSFHVISKATMS
jgi:hypothetical protein